MFVEFSKFNSVVAKGKKMELHRFISEGLIY